jgi:hypothetical protein
MVQEPDLKRRCEQILKVAELGGEMAVARLVKSVWLHGWWRGCFWGLCLAPVLVALSSRLGCAAWGV